MALTRAQLLMGNASQGTVLSGEVQGVKYGAGISIAADGTISVDSQTIVGVMKLGQTTASAAAAFNGYTWPASAGTAGQQLETNGSGVLTWADSDGIDWTAKGQLVVGTGNGTDTLLNVGTDGQILIANSGTTSGLAYTSNYVATTGATGAAGIPVGTTAQRPIPLVAGQFRYNSQLGQLELYDGSNWLLVASSTGGTFVQSTSATGSAVMPSGTTAQQDGTPALGYTRYNTSTQSLEFYGGATPAWMTVAAASSGSFVAKTSDTGSAVLPSGTTAQQGTAAAGYFRYNNQTVKLEFYDGSNWLTVQSYNPAVVSGFVSQTATDGAAVMPSGTVAQRPTSPAAGYTRFNTADSSLEVYSGTAWTTIPSSSTGTFVSQSVPTTGNASAIIPTGTTAQRQTAPAPAAGYFRYNTDTAKMEFHNGVSWQSLTTFNTSTIGYGLSPITSGTSQFVKALTPCATTSPAVSTTTAAGADSGSLYWDTQYGALFIYFDGTSADQWVMANGSNTTNGTTLNFPASPANGATYVGGNNVEYTYNSAKGVWTCPAGGTPAGLGLAVSGTNLKVSIPVAGTPPAAGTLAAQSIDGSLYWDNNLGVLFVRYNDGTSTQWVQAAGTSSSTTVVIPAGTKMLFAQASAPTGWTQDTSSSFNDVGIRLVNSTGGGTGGTIAFSSFFSNSASFASVGMTLSNGQVGATTITTNTMPAHTHQMSDLGIQQGATNAWFRQGTSGFYNFYYLGSYGAMGAGGVTSSVGSDQSHTHSLAGATATGTLTANFALKYVDVIVCSKN